MFPLSSTPINKSPPSELQNATIVFKTAFSIILSRVSSKDFLLDNCGFSRILLYSSVLSLVAGLIILEDPNKKSPMVLIPLLVKFGTVDILIPSNLLTGSLNNS